MYYCPRAVSLTIAMLLLVGGSAQWVQGQDKEDSAIAAIRKASEKTVAAFNAGKVDELTATFLPKGELIDEEGTIYQGQAEIKALLSGFFKKFPGSTLALEIESIRLVGPVAIEEGTRTITTKDGATKSRFRYIAIRSKTESGWQLASFRDFADDPAPTPHEYLQSLAWLVGEWTNEGADGKVAISYRWSEDKNFLLGEFQLGAPGKAGSKSSQRIGWDARSGKIRSWLFDADGGFSEGSWTMFDDEVVIKSTSVNPDGSSASATMTIVSIDKDHFSIKGTERIVGDAREPDFELRVSRRPPTPTK